MKDYKPSTELDRKAYEQRWNSKRIQNWRNKTATGSLGQAECHNVDQTCGWNDKYMDMYRDKKVAYNAAQPDWWTYEDNDPAWIEEHDHE